MNKETIVKTAICYWSNDDDCFVVESPLEETVLGAGDTAAEAWQSFKNILSDTYEAYLEGRMPNKRPGRPSKGGVPLNSDVKPETRDYIKALATRFGCSQGEVVDYITFFHEKTARAAKSNHTPVDKREILDSMGKAIKKLNESMSKLSHEHESLTVAESGFTKSIRKNIKPIKKNVNRLGRTF